MTAYKEQTALPRGLHPQQLALYRSLSGVQRETYWAYLRSIQDLRVLREQEARQRTWTYADEEENACRH